MSTLFRPCCGEVEMAPLRELQCLLTELNSCRGEWSWPRMAVASENWELSILKEKDTSEVNGNDENYACLGEFLGFQKHFCSGCFFVVQMDSFNDTLRHRVKGRDVFLSPPVLGGLMFLSVPWRGAMALRCWDELGICGIFIGYLAPNIRDGIGNP